MCVVNFIIFFFGFDGVIVFDVFLFFIFFSLWS